MQTVRGPGIDLYLQGNYAGAEAELKQALSTSPTWDEGLSYLGFALYMQQKYDEAATHLERAVLLDGDNAEARFGLGLVFAAQNRVDPAIACWDEVLRLKPQHADAKRSLVGGLMHRAQDSINSKHFEKAESDLERAMKIDRTSPQAACMLANHFIAQGYKPRAEKVIRDALAYMPEDPHIAAFAAQLDIKPDLELQQQQRENQARQQVQQSQEVPCPACKRSIMQWAVICPHCATQIKAMPSTFSGRLESVPKAQWQEVAYYIMSVLWILSAAVPLGLAMAKLGVAGAFSGFMGFFAVVYLLQILLGIGLLVQNETVMFVSKILCYPSLFAAAYGIMIAWGTKQWGGMAMHAFNLNVAGFMIYLLNYMGGD